MKIWISGEVDSDIFEDFRRAILDVESALLTAIEGKQFDVPLKSLSCIAIIRDDTRFPERTIYSKKKQTMDFRLAIPHPDFQAASAVEQRRLVVQMVQRSIRILHEKIPGCAPLADLLTAVTDVAHEKGW